MTKQWTVNGTPYPSPDDARQAAYTLPAPIFLRDGTGQIIFMRCNVKGK